MHFFDFWYCVICKLAQGTHFPIIKIISEYTEQDWT